MAKMIGLDQLLARMEKIPQAIRDEVEAELEPQVAEMVAALKRAAPVSELEEHPGQLRDSIEAYKPENSLPLRRRIIVGARDRKGVLFGRYVEFGHTTADGKYVPARPFFFPTYRARRKAFRRALNAAARRAVKKLFPKG